MPPPTLKVTVVGASGLRNADPVAFGLSDPYCVCRLASKPSSVAFQTPVVKDSLNPVWNHTVEVRDYVEGDSLLFSVYDKDDWPKQDDFLGQATLACERFFPQGFEGDVFLEDAGEGITASLRLVVSTSPPREERSADQPALATPILAPAAACGTGATASAMSPSTASTHPSHGTAASAAIPSAPSALSLSARGAIDKDQHRAKARAAARQTNFVEGESLEWLNAIFARIWGRVDAAVQHIVHEQVTPMLQAMMPLGLRGIHFTRCTLGSSKPNFGPIAACDTDMGLKLHLGMRYESDCDIALRAGPVTVGARKLRLRGELIVRLEPLINEAPVIGALVIYFLNEPELDLEFTGMGSIADCPGLSERVRSAITSAVAGSIVLPNVISVPMGTEAQGVDRATLNQPRPIGVLRVRALAVSGLRDGEQGHGRTKRSSKPYMRISVGGDTWRSAELEDGAESQYGDTYVHDFMVFDWEMRVLVEVLDDYAGLVLSSEHLIGRTGPISLCEAFDLSGQTLPLRRPRALSCSGGASPAAPGREAEPELGAGEVRLGFEWLEPHRGELGAEKSFLEIKVDEVYVPAKLGSSAKVTARLVNKEGREVATLSTRTGSEPAPGACQAAVMKATVGVVERCHALGMDHATIAHVAGLEAHNVAEILKDPAPAGKAATPSVARWAPPPAGMEQPEGTFASIRRAILCRKRAPALTSPAFQQRDLEESALLTAAPARPSAASGVVGLATTVTQLEVEATMYLLVFNSDFADTWLELTLVSEKNVVLGKTSMRLSAVAAAPGLTLPGPLWLAPAGGGQSIEAEIGVSLLGLTLCS